MIPQINGPYSARAARGRFINRNKLEYGIYDNEWQILPDTEISGGQLTTVPFSDNSAVPQIEGTESGPTLFAGFAPEQFGHAILNSLGRLWALEQLPNDTKLYFISKKRPLRSKYAIPLLNALSIKNIAVTSNVQLHFEELYTATNLFDEGFNSTTKVRFRDWLIGRLPPPPKTPPSRKIYVTRSKLGPLVGRFACEENLEILLTQSGFEIFAPERHSLAEQLEVYRSAQTIVFAESSSLHLFALVKRPDQNTIVINRREKIPALILDQLELFDDNPVKYINSIEEVYWPPVRADSRSLSVLNFSKLKEELIDVGVIKRDISWDIPTHQDIQISLRNGLNDGQLLYDKQSRKEFMRNYKSRMRAK